MATQKPEKANPIQLEFDRGTLVLQGDVPEGVRLPGCVYDSRVGRWRAQAYRYREVLTTLHRAGLSYENRAGGFETLELLSREQRVPFPYQDEAVSAFFAEGRRGVVVLPTGAGKTFVAQLILERLGRSGLVVTPTLDLVQQWYGVLKTAFDRPVGVVGGGEYDVQDLTVTTYDSAYIHMERLGDRFAVLVVDECHHLPGPTYSTAAEMCLAPFRLGLTATPEREDGLETKLDRLVGPVVYRREIGELAGEFLSDYETTRLEVSLSEEEMHRYEEERAIYRAFLEQEGLRLGGRGGWQRFLATTSRSERGRRAFLAYRAQKAIAQASEAKLRLLGDLLLRHRRDRVLIFTSDNETVYKISRRFLVPAITHQTKVKERHRLLSGFNDGRYPFLVTSKVLNEGVDVPAANIGIVLSGSGSVREHVQRLGRILRRGEGKRAKLYEVVARDTAEEYTSRRRRQHGAYER
ncbi:MAG: DEAD/DEAH box helicase family protein [Thermoanaerobaculia bacterium]|nr:DEAD/DEAH box helicase family protein [Thermoanaerobaculia bacterium]